MQLARSSEPPQRSLHVKWGARLITYDLTATGPGHTYGQMICPQWENAAYVLGFGRGFISGLTQLKSRHTGRMKHE